MPAPGLEKEQALLDGGFAPQEVEQWKSDARQALLDGGFSGKEADEYFGIKEPNMAPMKKMFEENLAKKASEPSDPNKPKPENADTFLEALEAGWQMSTAGLISRGEMPSTLLPENAPMFYRIASQAATLAGDIPAMMAGGAIGGAAGGAAGAAAGSVALPVVGTVGLGTVGAVAGAGAGSFALPTAIRETLMDHYKNGDFKNFSDFWERSSAIFLDTAKSAAVGAVTAGVGGKAAQLAKPIASPALRATSVAATEVATMVTVGKALEGQVPNFQDFGDAAVLLGGLHLGVKVGKVSHSAIQGKLQNIYAKTGVKPSEVFQEAQVDPVLKQELLSSNVDLPTAYKGMVEKPTAVETTPAPKAQKLDPTLTEKSNVLGEGFAKETVIEPLPAKPVKEVKVPEIQRTEAETAILSRIGERRPEPWTKERIVEKAHEVYTDVVDALHPIKQFTEKATGGKKLSVADDPYALLRLSRGDFGRLQQFINNGSFDFKTYKTTGKSFVEILEPIKKDPDGLRAYAISSRALELNGRGIETGVPLDQAQTVVTQGSKKYQKVLDDLVEFQNQALAHLRDSGIKSEKEFNAMTEANKSFVSFRRLMEDGGGKGAGKGSAVRDPVKNIKGSERLILDPIQTAVENVSLYLTMAERNRAMVKMVELAEANPETGGALMKKVKTPQKPIDLKPEEITKILKEHGLENVDPEPFTIFRPQANRLAENEIAVFRNGKREVYEVAPEVAGAIKNFDAETTGLFVKVMGGFTKSLKAGSVLSPDFMARNFSRDMMTAFNLGKGAFTPLDTLNGLGSLFKKDQHYQNWLKGGGSNSSFMAIDKSYLDTNVFKLSKETGLIDKVWNVPKTALEMLRVTGELVENATRLGEFKRVTGGKTDIKSVMEGAFASREVTLDFARMGAKTRATNMLVAFFNAHVQGLDKSIRAIKDRPGETAAKIAASITLPSVLLWFANKDDPRWKEIPRWQKDLFWIVMTDKTVYRIPKPAELGLLFGSVPERTLETYFSENPKAFKDFEDTLIEAFAPGFVPTAAVPVVEHYFNKSTFTGHSVVPRDLEGILPEYQYTEYTTEAGKILGKMISAVPGFRDKSLSSPMVIENYIRGWSGSMGKYALQVADKLLIESGAIPDPIKPEDTLADMAIVKAFVIRHPSSTAQSIQDFYDRYSQNKQQRDTIKHLAKRGEFEAMQKEMRFAEQEGRLIQLDETRETLGNLSRYARSVYRNKNLTPNEKRQQIDGAYNLMINAAKAGNKVFDEVEKSIKK